MKAAVGDHVILVKPVTTDMGLELPEGTHGFVVEITETDEEAYVVEFYVPREPPQYGDDLELVTIRPDKFGVA